MYSLGADRIENTAFIISIACFSSNNSATAASASVAAQMFLESHCLAKAVCSGSAIPGFSRHVTISLP
jgi:hypothetical protein